MSVSVFGELGREREERESMQYCRCSKVGCLKFVYYYYGNEGEGLADDRQLIALPPND